MTVIEKVVVSRDGEPVCITLFAEVGERLQNLLLLNPGAAFTIRALEDGEVPGEGYSRASAS